VTRLTDLPPNQTKRLAGSECPDFEARPWVTGPALSIPPAVALGLLVRRRAPTGRARTALAAGLSSAAGALSSSCSPSPGMTPSMLHCARSAARS
jgi:hypothetical protein